jgi:NhaA family Na+:H+ antiporter
MALQRRGWVEMTEKNGSHGYMAPWEAALDRILTPLEEFIHRQTTSGVLFMLCAVLALAVANSPWNASAARQPHSQESPDFPRGAGNCR